MVRHLNSDAFVAFFSLVALVLQDLAEWLQVLQQMAEAREAMVQRMVRQSNLSQELSDLVVYCQPVQFDIESKLFDILCHYSYITKTSICNWLENLRLLLEGLGA